MSVRLMRDDFSAPFRRSLSYVVCTMMHHYSRTFMLTNPPPVCDDILPHLHAEGTKSVGVLKYRTTPFLSVCPLADNRVYCVALPALVAGGEVQPFLNEGSIINDERGALR